MNEEFGKNQAIKISNIVRRIAEIDMKMVRLQETKDQLYVDLKKNKELQENGPKAGTPKTLIVSESLEQQILANIGLPPEHRSMSAFSQKK